MIYIMVINIDTHVLEEFLHLDDLNVTDGTIRVGDLGSINDEIKKSSMFHLVYELKLAVDEYSMMVYVKPVGKYGNRIMAMLFLPVTLIDGLLTNIFEITFEKLGLVGVDTGTIGVVNKTNSIDDTFLETIELPYADQDGIYINSGFGDGLYPIYIAKRKGKTVGLFIDFYSPYLESKFNMVSPFVDDRKGDVKVTKRESKRGSKKGSKSGSKKGSNKRDERPSPSVSATTQKTGTIKTGNDKNKWIVVENKNGIKRWKLHESRERPSPSTSASRLPTGTKKKGNDGKIWIVVETKNGVKRWKHAQ